MAAEDVRFILDIKNPSNVIKDPRKLEQINKEMFTVAGGVPPLAPVHSLKETRLAVKKAEKWVWVEFENPARTTDRHTFKLWHWQKASDIHDQYPFAKLNKKIELITFTHQEYITYIKEMDPSWSEEETDFLYELLARFDLRFIVVHDRFNNQETNYRRSIEEIKERYYSISRRLLELRGDHNHPLVKKPYNFEYEVKRKNNLEKIFVRTPDQCTQEKKLLEEIKSLEQKIKKEEKEQRNLEKNMRVMGGKNIHNEKVFVGEGEGVSMAGRRNRKLFVNTNLPRKGSVDAVSSPLLSPSVGGRGGRRDRGSGVYLRSNRLNAPLPISERLNKKLGLVLKELAVTGNLLPTAAVLNLYDQLRKEILRMFSLKAHERKKEEEKHLLEEKVKEQNRRKIQTGGGMLGGISNTPTQSTHQNNQNHQNPPHHPPRGMSIPQMPPQTTYTNPSTTTPQQYHQGQHHIPPNSIPRGSGGQGMGSRDGSVKQVIGNVNTMVFNQGPYPRGGGGLPVNIHGVGIHPDGRVPLVDAGAPPVIDKRTKKGRAVTAEKRVIYIYIYIYVCMYIGCRQKKTTRSTSSWSTY